MDPFWKQFVGLGTDSAHSVFLRARLKLTALYIVIVTVIVVGFSLFIYQHIGAHLRDASDDDFAGPDVHQHFVDHALVSLQSDLLLADFIIIFATAGLSFVFAGRTLRPIQQSLHAQKTFAENASHELRTPLAVMRNDIEVLLRHSSHTKDSAETTLKSNLEEIARMSSIVEDLLLLARSDNNASITLVTLADVDLNEVVKTICSRMTPLATKKHVTLSYTSAGPAMIQGEERLIERAIVNIVQNSIEHTGDGGTIIARIERTASSNTLHISDTGVGIAPSRLAHVFDRFYKGDSAQGTGLGLSIVKEIVKQHDGVISIESTEGKGTTIQMTFPKVSLVSLVSKST